MHFKARSDTKCDYKERVTVYFVKADIFIYEEKWQSFFIKKVKNK